MIAQGSGSTLAVMKRVPAVIIRRLVLAVVLLQGLTAVSVVSHPSRELRIVAIVGVIAAVAVVAPLLHHWANGELPLTSPGTGRRRRRLRRLPRAARPHSPESPASR
jgi:hypothetical protein